jgi:hypothetical protein
MVTVAPKVGRGGRGSYIQRGRGDFSRGRGDFSRGGRGQHRGRGGPMSRGRGRY